MLPPPITCKLLFGPYRPPRCKLGQVVQCQVRGDVPVKRVSAGRIPWPVTCGKARGRPSLIVFGGLAEAVRAEAAIAVAYWWGVSPQTVSVWRKALGVPQVNTGTARLYHVY